MAFKENTTTSEKAATLIEETENINAELAEIDRQLAEMENSPDKPEGLSRISHAGKNDNALLTDFTLNGKINFAYSIWLQKNHFGYSDTKTVELVPKSDPVSIPLEQQVADAGLVWDDETGEFVPGKGD